MFATGQFGGYNSIKFLLARGRSIGAKIDDSIAQGLQLFPPVVVRHSLNGEDRPIANFRSSLRLVRLHPQIVRSAHRRSSNMTENDVWLLKIQSILK